MTFLTENKESYRRRLLDQFHKHGVERSFKKRLESVPRRTERESENMLISGIRESKSLRPS